MKDFICHSAITNSIPTTLHKQPPGSPIESLIPPSYPYQVSSNFSSSYIASLANITNIAEPYSYKQAIKHKEGVAAMEREIDALEANDTRELTTLSAEKHVIGTKWEFKVKFLPDGKVERFKAWLVAK